MNGCKMDKEGNILRKRSKNKSVVHNNPYKKVKSRFREHLDSLCDSDSKARSSKMVPSMFSEAGKEAGKSPYPKKIIEKLNQSDVKDTNKKRLLAKRGRFYTEGDNAYLSNLGNKGKAIEGLTLHGFSPLL